MNRKKSIAVAIVLIGILLIGGLLAYFTDTDTVTNVFTLGGNVDISLLETNWSNGGSGTEYTLAEAVGIHPGTTINKDPKIKNDSTTTPAYVFAEIIVPCYATTGTTANAPLFIFTTNPGWTLINTPEVNTTDKTITYVYAYGTASVMTSLAKETTTPAVFSSVTLEPSLTEDQKATAPEITNIVVNAYAIQTDGLGVTDPVDIFALFNS